MTKLLTTISLVINFFLLFQRGVGTRIPVPKPQGMVQASKLSLAFKEEDVSGPYSILYIASSPVEVCKDGLLEDICMKSGRKKQPQRKLTSSYKGTLSKGNLNTFPSRHPVITIIPPWLEDKWLAPLVHWNDY